MIQIFNYYSNTYGDGKFRSTEDKKEDERKKKTRNKMPPPPLWYVKMQQSKKHKSKTRMKILDPEANNKSSEKEDPKHKDWKPNQRRNRKNRYKWRIPRKKRGNSDNSALGTGYSDQDPLADQPEDVQNKILENLCKMFAWESYWWQFTRVSSHVCNLFISKSCNKQSIIEKSTN